jgi:hypothetical protein
VASRDADALGERRDPPRPARGPAPGYGRARMRAFVAR